MSLILIFFVIFGYTQTTNIVLQKCYGLYENGPNTSGDDPYCIESIPEGFLLGIQVRGPEAYGYNNYHGNGDMWIVKLDSLGNIVWERCYGGSDGDWIRKIVVANDSTYYLFGGSYSNDGDILNTRPGEFWVAKIDSSGAIIWENNYGSEPAAGESRDAIVAPDGGLIFMSRIVFAGGDVSTYYGQNDIWVCRLDPDGNILWEKTLGTVYNENALKMILTSSNTILVTGGHAESTGMITCPDLGNYGADCWIVEMDLDGNIVQQHCYGGSYDEVIYDIVEVDDGYAFTAWTNSNDQDVSGFHGVPGDESNNDIWVCKISYLGEIQWEKCLGGSKLDYPQQIESTEDGGFMIFGSTKSTDGDVSNNHTPFQEFDIWMVKLDSLGNIEYDHCFGSIYEERFWGSHCVAKKSDDHYGILARSTYISEDVECDLYGAQDFDSWFFEIKDCSNYMPSIPSSPTGPDTLCITTDSTATYSIIPAAGAWSYEWQVVPTEAGNITSDSTSATLYWAPGWEGQAQISVRSWNDCGQSAWSEIKNTWAFSCLGIESPSLVPRTPYLHVFPNPAFDEISIRYQIPDAGCRMIIFDLYGQKMTEINVPNGKTQISVDVASFKPSVYIIVLRNDTGFTAMGKFMKR